MNSTLLKRDEDLLLVSAYNRVRSARLKLSNPSETMEAFYDEHPILAKAERKIPATWQNPDEVFELFKTPKEKRLLTDAADEIRKRWKM